MENYGYWEFLIGGGSQDLREFSTGIRNPYFSVYGGVDHWNDCPNDDFRMKTIYCHNEDDPRIVWQIGYELISLFNGAACMLNKNFRKLFIERVLHKEKHVEFYTRTQVAALLGKPNLSQDQIKAELENVKSYDKRLWLLNLATENQDIYLILKYFDMEGSWLTYYKLLETLETFESEKGIDLKTNKTIKEHFKLTANNFSMTGFDSRHGFKKLQKKIKKSSMSIEEAHTFIADMAKKYISRVYV